jgi:hypothetical protein
VTVCTSSSDGIVGTSELGELTTKSCAAILPYSLDHRDIFLLLLSLDLSISILGTEIDLVAWECYEMAVSAQSAFRAGDLDHQAPIPNFNNTLNCLSNYLTTDFALSWSKSAATANLHCLTFRYLMDEQQHVTSFELCKSGLPETTIVTLPIRSIESHPFGCFVDDHPSERL